MITFLDLKLVMLE